MPSTKISPRRPSFLDHCLITALLVAIVVHAAVIVDLLWPSATYASYFVQISVFLFYLFFPLTRIRLAIQIPAIAIFLFLVLEHVWFCHLSQQPYNFNAVLTYIELLSFLPFYRSGVPISRILKILFILITLYLLFYVVGHNSILSGALGDNRAIHDGDTARGSRLYLAAAFASFVAYYAMTNRRLGFLLRSGAFLIAVYALWLSGFRTFGLIFVIVMLLSLMRLLGGATRLALFGLFCVISGTLLLGFLVPHWNPFNYMSWDGSAFARSLEYRVAMKVVQQHWMWGVGIANTFDAQQIFFRTREYEPLYPSDLGILGPLILFGIPGVVAFVAATYFCIASPLRRDGGSGIRGLQLNCIACGLYGVISPSLMIEQNAVFLSLLFVAQLRAGQLFWWVRFEKLWFEAVPLNYRPVLQSFRAFVSNKGRNKGMPSHYSPPTDGRNSG